MAIDSVRLLTDSAAQIWRGLSRYSSIESLTASDCFDDWIAATALSPALDRAEEQSLRRDYRRLITLIDEIETLVRSRSRALDLVRTRIAEDSVAS
jgi:trans-aconitate methyltransferase